MFDERSLNEAAVAREEESRIDQKRVERLGWKLREMMS
jgi:hypothetical protein